MSNPYRIKSSSAGPLKRMPSMPKDESLIQQISEELLHNSILSNIFAFTILTICLVEVGFTFSTQNRDDANFSATPIHIVQAPLPAPILKTRMVTQPKKTVVVSVKTVHLQTTVVQNPTVPVLVSMKSFAVSLPPSLSKNPSKWPVAFLDFDMKKASSQQKAGLIAIRSDFMKNVVSQKTNPPTYDLSRWVNAQRQADELFKALFGLPAFNQHQFRLQATNLSGSQT